ncbi:MAG: carboxypeptidase regulatory-like domain-containing protein, partial [Acidobacteria bacterium]|nr:carboxypeptidase regulatory-like domain-containing protein [Acidobacteriota bacterium]
MDSLCFAGGPKRRRAVVRAGLLALALVLALAGATAAQSVMGSIRGTVTDASGGVIPKAAVLITDENTGVPRAVETGPRGTFEVPNLKPGTYRIEVTVTSFKKFEQAGVVVSTGSVALVDARLEVGPLGETVTVSAQAPANIITLDSPAVTKGLDEQQLRDLPRGSRDIASFLYLNPNVAGTDDQMQFLGGRTYGVSYIQDGQASTNAIFGTVGNSAPGLDAIAEMQVLSNSYSAEYGGLAGVVVTTKRGGQKYHGTGFYDFNSNSLNSLTYGQKLTDVSRDDPNADTKQQRYGVSFGGPVAGRTFFFANYEGMRDKSIQGGGTITLPNAALRAGDFSGSTITVRDPLTGLPFPGNVIPAGRISQISKDIMNYFWPLPTRDIKANGMGTFQQYVPVTRMRERFDLRMDHEAGSNNQFFARGSYQYRKPTRFQWEAGTALTNMPLINSSMTTYTAVGGWTSILTSTIVNEMRVGYNYDQSGRTSTLKATAVAAQFGIEAAPSITADIPGFPSILFTTGSNRPGNITDGGRNNNRTIKQNSLSFADNISWMKGAHSMRAGALISRNSAIDGFGRGLNHRGNYRFGNGQTGNAFGDFLLGLPTRVDEHMSTRGDLNGYSTDFATFFQDDWRVNKSLTLFFGVRYEVAGGWHEKNKMLANFQAEDGGYHVVANQQVWDALPYGLSNSSSPWYSHVKLASDLGLPDTLVKTDKNNFSPRLGYAYRLDSQGKTVLRGGFGLFHPTTAIQGIRDQLAANEFRYTIQR